MNDFFNVLDDFELEDFAPAGEPVGESTFNLDVEGDSSKSDEDHDTIPVEDVDYGEAALNSIKTNKDTITEDDKADDGNIYVWSNGTNPFANGTVRGVYFSADLGNPQKGGADGDIDYYELSLNRITGISLTKKLTTPVVISRGSSGTEITGSAGVSINLTNGIVKGGFFNYGDAWVSLGSYSGSSAASYNNGGIITVAVQGFDNPADNDNLGWEGDENNFKTITTTQDEGASVKVTNDYNFDVDDHEVKIKNVASGTVVFTYGSDGGDIELDISGLTATTTDGTKDILQVVEAADAETLIPPTATITATTDDIKIGKTQYDYASSGNAYFTLNDDGTVEGYVLADTNDAIKVAKNQEINVYDEDDPDNALATVDGSGYTITKTRSAYTLTVTNSAEVTIGETTLDFTIAKDLGTKPVTITFDEDGLIEEVAGLTNLTAGDTLKVTGADVTTSDGGLPVLVGTNSIEYISVSDGDFTYTAGTTPQITVADDGVEVYAVHADSYVVVGTNGGTITDPDGEYTYKGTGYFEANEDDVIVGYVFGAAGDSVDLETANSDFTVKYNGKEIDVPTVTDSDGKFTVTMDNANEFKISELEANAVVEDIVFAGDGGEVLFDADGNIIGVNTSEGNDTIPDKYFKNEGFLVDGVAMPAIDNNGTAITYNKEHNYLIAGNKVYALGTTNDYYGEYKYSGEEDGLVVYTFDTLTGSVLNVGDLNGGTVTGDFTGLTAVNGSYIITTDSILSVEGNGGDFVAIGALDDGELYLSNARGANGFTVNNDILGFNAAAGGVSVEGNANEITLVKGLGAGDTVAIIENTDKGGNEGDAVFVFESDSTDGQDDVYTVNGTKYTIVNDKDGVSITSGGKVDGLDAGAKITSIDPAQAVTVNGAEYTAEDVADVTADEAIIGYDKKTEGELGSYKEDPNYPLITADDDWIDVAAKLEDAKNSTYSKAPTAVIAESDDASAVAAATAFGATYETLSATETVLDFTKGDHATDRVLAVLNNEVNRNVTFNDSGNNVAVVTEDAEGDKSIKLGNKADLVIMDGDDAYAKVNIIGGTSADTVVVTNSEAVVFDMSAGGADKLMTFAQANARVTLNAYDETSKAGIMIHDPEIANVTQLREAIEDGLLMFEDGKVLAIDRDEARDGTDQISEIVVNNKNASHQTMVRLFGYKDNGDAYADDKGQLVGFTDSTGGTLDASDLDENLVLIGNYHYTGNADRNKAGSNLKSGEGDDTIYAGGNDTVNAGAGNNEIVLNENADRDAARIVLGAGKNTVENFNTGFEGDVFDVGAVSSSFGLSFDGEQITISDSSEKFEAVAAVDTEADYVTFLADNNGETIKAAVAVEGGTISVTGGAPNYFVAPSGAVDFSSYDDEVTVDIDGDWAQSAIGGENATFQSGINSLIGGNGTTLFKGGSNNETLVAGTGEGSLYGGGGKNVLVGNSSEDKVGSTEFFVQGLNNGAQHTISGFEFVADGAENTATADALNLSMTENDVTDVKANADGSISIAVQGIESGNVEKVTIEGAVGQEIYIDRGQETETVAQIATTEVTVNNSYVDFYCATDDANGATVKVGDIDATEIWLNAPDYGNGVDFTNSRFTVVDARGSAAEILVAGNDIANTIYGGTGNATMWGGSGIVDDVMYGGSGHNEFYFESYNGNDTIMSANDGDVIQLGVTLDQIDFDNTNISASGVEIKLTDGSSLTVNSTANVDIVLDDGTTAKVNHQTGQFE